MKEKILMALRSRTVWSVAALFLVSGTEGVKDKLSPELQLAAEAFLALAAIYFRAFPKQQL